MKSVVFLILTFSGIWLNGQVNDFHQRQAQDFYRIHQNFVNNSLRGYTYNDYLSVNNKKLTPRKVEKLKLKLQKSLSKLDAKLNIITTKLLNLKDKDSQEFEQLFRRKVLLGNYRRYVQNNYNQLDTLQLENKK